MADEKGALSLAALMGGAASAVSDGTQNIVLGRLGLRPKSSPQQIAPIRFLVRIRRSAFERGVDYRLQADAIERATELVLQICGGAAGEMVEAQGELPEAKHIAFGPSENRVGRGHSCRTGGNHFATLWVCSLRKRRKRFRVTAPSFRFDIEIEADLIEEIGRVYGIMKTSPTITRQAV